MMHSATPTAPAPDSIPPLARLLAAEPQRRAFALRLRAAEALAAHPWVLALLSRIDPAAADELARNASQAVRGAIADAAEHRVAHFGLRADPDALADAAVATLDAIGATVERLGLENSAQCDRIFALEAAVRRGWERERRLRRERDVARRQLAALRDSAQRLARAGRTDVLGAELPEVWRLR